MSNRNDVLQALHQLLNSGTEVDRCHVCRALGTLQDTDAIEVLATRLRDDDIDVCIDAATALAELADPAAIDPLLESLQQDPDGEVRTAIIKALGKLDDPRAMVALLAVAATRPDNLEWDADWDPWWDMQLEAVVALGENHVEAAVPTLCNILDDEACQDIESEVLKALARIGNSALTALMRHFYKGSKRNRRRVMEALRFNQQDNIARHLAQGLKDASAEVRLAAIQTLVDRRAKHFMGVVLLMLHDPNANVRSAAMRAIATLSQLDGESGLDTKALISMLADPDPQVRNNAAQLLATSSNADLSVQQLAQIRNCLTDRNPQVIITVCEVLTNVDDKQAVPALLELLSDSGQQTEVRRQAALTLGRIGEATSPLLDALADAIGDDTQAVRLAALCALVELDHPDGKITRGPRPLDKVIAALKGQCIPHTMQKNLANTESENGLQVAFQSKLIQPGNDNATHNNVSDHSVTNNNAEQNLPAGADSTLAAIALDNVETTLLLNQVEHKQELANPDASASPATLKEQGSLQEYEKLVEQNNTAGEWLAADKLRETTLNIADDVRYLAARMLASRDDAVVVNALVEALNDQDSELRREAADALARIAERTPCLPELVNSFGSLMTQLQSGNHEMRLACTRALGVLGNRQAIDVLLDGLKDEEPAVRIESISALYKLTSNIQASADHMVVTPIAAETVLQQIKNTLDDPAAGVRTTAAHTLGRMLNESSPSPSDRHRHDLVEHIISAAFKGDGGQARTLAKVLRNIDAKLAADKVIPQLTQLEDSSERRFAIEILEELFKPIMPDSTETRRGQAA